MNEKLYSNTRELSDTSIGSKRLQEIAWKNTVANTLRIDKQVADFVEYIWNETIGDLETIFGFELNSENTQSNFSIEQVLNILLKFK